MPAYFNTSLTLMSLYNKVRRQVSEAELSAADRQYLEFSNFVFIPTVSFHLWQGILVFHLLQQF